MYNVAGMKGVATVREVSRILCGVVVLVFVLGVHSQAAAGWQNSLKPKGKPSAKLSLAVNGITNYVIVIPEKPTPQEQKAGEELAHWLGEVTGAKFPIVKDSEKPRETELSIGRTNRLASSAAELLRLELGEEGYAITVKGKRILLVGGRKRGPIYAVLALLEEDVGCRWYTRKVNRIPKKPTLRLRIVPRSYMPPFRLRDPFYKDAFDGRWSLLNRTNAPRARIPKEWGGNLNYVPGWFVHTFNRIVPPSKYFDVHPEYYQLDKKGKRTHRNPCPTHPEVVRIAVRKVLEAVARSPDSELISVSKNDIRGVCQCPTCKALNEAEGSPSAGPLSLVNKVAEAVEEVRPDALVTTLAYHDTVQPPKTMRPRPNVVIRLCTDSCMWRHPFTPARDSEYFRTALEGWARIHDKIFIWDYSVNFGNYMEPWPSFHAIAENLRFYARNNVIGVMIQGAYQSTGNERELMRSWVFAKLLWDPSRDTWELMKDFIWGYYGRAAPPLIKYNKMLYRAGLKHKRISQEPGFLEKAKALFARAEELAPNEEILHRVELARLPIIDLEVKRLLKELPRHPDTFDREYFLSLLGKFEEVARREKLWKVAERLRLDDWLKRMRKLVSPPTPAELIKQKYKGTDVFLYRLSANWKFARDLENVGQRKGWFKTDFDDSKWSLYRVDLGVGWEEQGFSGDGFGWFRKLITVPKELNRKHLYLYFRAVDEEAWVYIDGKLVHENTVKTTGLEPFQLWLAPFAVEAIGMLKPGASHHLCVRVYDSAGMGGIYLPVFLVSSDAALTAREITALARIRNPWQ